MTASLGRGDWVTELACRLAGADRIAIVGIGDELSPVDRPGMLAARQIEALSPAGTRVFLAGTVPESMTGPVKAFRPDHIILLDAAEMGRPPGAVAVLDPETVSASLFSTHALPLPVVMDYLKKETGATVTLLGIQPDLSTARNVLPAEEDERFAGAIEELARVLRDARNSSGI